MDQGSNPSLPHWQADSLPPAPPGKFLGCMFIIQGRLSDALRTVPNSYWFKTMKVYFSLMSITEWLGSLVHGIFRPGLKLTGQTLFGTLPFFMRRRGFVVTW